MAVLTFVFMEQPTGITILVIAALLLVVLAVIEFLGRPGDGSPAEVQGDVVTPGATAAPTGTAATVPAATVVTPAPREGESQDVVSSR